ncbi:hypothetical protein ABNB59_07805 [Paenibacillus larvae]|uniref:Uncharacterized protein n=5 Tax=Paenibacillus larvae TaxID=1464 RepID=V9WBV9_9BACL|nr:hypothetical protein [Paenibacillus larvae]AHD07334.1 hypothetical protein ERIC2_c36170 [Paenibacillus larvae subsp. larvae DSM 25430]AQR79189.1 hypothetical protein BXP28_20140 [Paenibacillus larvae subsp. larvae]AVF23675.1 hypothetical protein ERICI_03942 [Paenibacillus larvae subsp. larvae]AVG13898.1 hypothetical protein ERICII_03603 [Paenibacillus larvae subsp. larvae DSM 25430]ETK29655.1 hypothetical protein ERIC1_1c32120 [Paenibacillus larvae subsp. larvae DSM 25719]
MKKNFFVIALSASLFAGIMAPTASLASTPANSEQSTNIVSDSNIVYPYSKKLEPYVHLQSDGTLLLDESYKKNVYVPNAVIHSISFWMNLLNQDVKNGDAVIHSDLSVTYNGQTDRVKSAVALNTTHYSIFWWGCMLYFSHSDTQYIARALDAGANGQTVGVIISRLLHGAPENIIASAGSFLYNMGAKQLRTLDWGNGIYISLPLQGTPGSIYSQK